ncbi:MAG: ABC-F family ATP-binding cassette domain-containing protein [Stenotrophomonas nitritireducens]|nr:ABC-F family ATP-binding cassette domain-containing protein [Stenotrophomonas nitritireducens]MBN8793205.1 ABC-F family ATP-binding cassette domain-containing protein [Stenotrophomonas nitritireducens]MBN8797236.1 ABC-F family ATP-binding cassette domain-containing protein [Stenotrophomonas nitritireducens]
MTTTPFLTLERVCWQLPDGRLLFSDLDETFDARPTGLVGRNGVGKSVLAQLLAGRLAPTRGRCLRSGPVAWLPQQIDVSPTASVADLAGLGDALAALRRIEQGSSDVADFEVLGERWQLREQLQTELERMQLCGVSADTPASRLSGGQRMRVALAGAFLSDADFLVLDEPSNHLDAQGRQLLREQLRRWPRGLLVVSHDRALLGDMQRIVELSPLGLRSHGGNYAFYAARSSEERRLAAEALQQRRHERRQGEQALREQQEQREHRAARGNRQAAHANQAPILLGRQKQRAQASAGKAHLQQQQQRERLDEQVRQAAAAVEAAAPVVLLPVAGTGGAPERVAVLEEVVLPFVDGALARIDLLLRRGERLALTGRNGSGKSVLLKVLAGHLRPLQGAVQVNAPHAWLDQHLALPIAAAPAMAQLRHANPAMAEAGLRTRLALLGLDAGQAQRPVEALSGGERMKLALACALYAQPPAQLLLLDEPANHLDLDAMQALETMLRDWPGTLLVAAHDEAFLQGIGITGRLHADAGGWRRLPP